ncbi:MAG: glycosyl hydrolase 53 family protein [Candidatus Goldbacteria bacterium]|nr:glycosyl hydrolase 53 family protein [Candidatus Goldiibacteriota bacterium]
MKFTKKLFYFLLNVPFLFLIFSKSYAATFANGADVGWLSQMESSGYKFYDDNGVQRDCLQILKDHCIDSIRLRVWVNPSGGWCGKQDVVNMALRAKNMGFRIMIDFHYSDSWADPGKQTKPAAWAGYDFNQLVQAVYDHTYDVLNTLAANGITPEWVQVGNETNDGMLWEDGRASANMGNFARLISSGYDAVKAVNPQIKVIVHISNGYDNGLFRWIFDGLKNNGEKWDVIGMSLYPEPTNWQTLTGQCLTNMNDMIIRYSGKEVMICEIGMDYREMQASHDFITDIINKTKSLAGNKGLGVFYWEPECYNWQGYTKGAWNTNGRPTIAMDAFLENCPINLPSPTFTRANINTFTMTRTITASFTSTATRTRTATGTVTRTNTVQPTETFTGTWTNTPSLTVTDTISSNTPTITQTWTETPLSPTNTPTITQTWTVTSTGTWTRTGTPTYSRTATLTQTATSSQQPTNTFTGTRTNTPGLTVTDTISSNTPTITQSWTMTSTLTWTRTVTSTLTRSATGTSTRTNTMQPTGTFTWTMTSTQMWTMTNTRTSTPTPTFMQTVTRTVTRTFTQTNTPSFTMTITPTRTQTATLLSTKTITQTATSTVIPDEKELKIEDVVIYPNPYNPDNPDSGDLHIGFEITQACKMINVRIYTSGFRLVKQITHTGNYTVGRNVIDIESRYIKNLANGSYFVIISAINKQGKQENSKPEILVILK